MSDIIQDLAEMSAEEGIDGSQTLQFAMEEIRGLRTRVSELEEQAKTLFDAIQHGDEEHREWLKQAIEDHFAGREVQQVRGGGNVEKVKQLESTVSQLQREKAELVEYLGTMPCPYKTPQRPHDGPCVAGKIYKLTDNNYESPYIDCPHHQFLKDHGIKGG